MGGAEMHAEGVEDVSWCLLEVRYAGISEEK
jgi:hypothetical protein